MEAVHLNVLIAISQWILTPSYVEACGKAGRFVEESMYQWEGVGTPGDKKAIWSGCVER